MKSIHLALIALVFSFLSLTLSAQEEPEQGSKIYATIDEAFIARMSGLFAAEDPQTLYSFNLYDSEVEFFLDGSWEASLEGALLITFDHTGSRMSLSPPIFTQRVDLTTWLFIDKTWYFEAAFAEEFTRNTVAAGYVGDDESAIKHVRIGNAGIVFPDRYPFIVVGGGRAIQPGIMGTFSGEGWKADALVRYDSLKEKEMVLSGMNEVTDTLIPIENPVRGKWFALPDPVVSGSVEVYVEDENGKFRDDTSYAAGRRWRKLDSDEWRLEGIGGILTLNSATTKSVAIVYSGAWAGAGPALQSFIQDTRLWFESSGQSISSSIIPDPSLPDYQSELANKYITRIDGKEALLIFERGRFSPFNLASRYECEGTTLDVINSESETPYTGFDTTLLEGSWAELFITPATWGERRETREAESRFPLANRFPGIYLRPGLDTTGIVIRSRGYTPIGSISLGDNVIAGTIRVTRNGITETNFRFEEESGILTLLRDPGITETIRIYWSETDSGGRNAALTIAGGIEWEATKALTIHVASSFIWNISQNGYTDAGESSPGSLVLSTGFAWKENDFQLSSAFAAELSVSDTTGTYRLLGMDGGERLLHPASDWYIPVSTASAILLNAPAMDSLENPSVRLEAQDYIEPEGILNDKLPSTSSSAQSSANLNLQATLTNVDSWTGAVILTGEKGGLSYTGARTIRMEIRNSGSRDDYELYLQLGARTEKYYEDTNTIRTWKLETPAADGEWKIAGISLNDEDRSILAAGQDMRLIIRPSPASAISESDPLAIRLSTATIEITETEFTASLEPQQPNGSGTFVTERLDTHNLAARKDEVLSKFISSSVNRVLAFGFTPHLHTISARLTRFFPEAPFDVYRTFAFYLYPERLPEDDQDLDSARMSVRLTRASTTGEKAALDISLSARALESGTWNLISINLDTNTVQVNGRDIPASQVMVNARDRSVRPVRLDLIFTGWPTLPEDQLLTAYGSNAWGFIVDEWYLEETEQEIIGRNQTTLAWKKEGPVVSALSTPVISNPSLSIRSDSATGTGVTESVVSTSAEASVDILRAKTSGFVSASSASDRAIDSAGYTLSIPVGPVTASENYQADFGLQSVRREDSLFVAGVLNGRLDGGIHGSGRSLTRNLGFTLSPYTPSGYAGFLSVELASRFRQEGLSPRPDIQGDSWGALWSDSLWWLTSLGEEEAWRREGKNSARLIWNTPWKETSAISLSSLQIYAGAASGYYAVQTVQASSTMDFELSFPINLYSTLLTPSWTRSAITEGKTTAGGDYLKDSETLLSDISRMDFLVETPPIADLCMDDLGSTIRDDRSEASRTFINRYAIDWSRSSQSRLSDIWTPSSLGTFIMRETMTDAVSLEVPDTWTAGVKAGFNAINIAGNYSRLALFPWYTQDEISQIYTWSSKWGTQYYTWSIDVWHSLLLFFETDATISIENTFHYDSPSQAGQGELTRDSIAFIWKRPIDHSFLTALVRLWTNWELTSRREDSIHITVSAGEQLTAQAGWDHTLATGIGKNGEVAVFGGFIWNRYDKEMSDLSIRLGCRGKVMY